MLWVEHAVVAPKVTPALSTGALRSLWLGALRLPRRGAPSVWRNFGVAQLQYMMPLCYVVRLQQLFHGKQYVKLCGVGSTG